MPEELEAPQEVLDLGMTQEEYERIFWETADSFKRKVGQEGVDFLNHVLDLHEARQEQPDA